METDGNLLFTDDDRVTALRPGDELQFSCENYRKLTGTCGIFLMVERQRDENDPMSSSKRLHYRYSKSHIQGLKNWDDKYCLDVVSTTEEDVERNCHHLIVHLLRIISMMTGMDFVCIVDEFYPEMKRCGRSRWLMVARGQKSNQ